MGRKSRADQRRAQIIQAFFQCVADQGIARASVRNIAEKAGVQPSTLHHYFKNKDEIIEQAVVEFTDSIFDRFKDRMAGLGRNPRASDRVDLGMAFIFSSGMINEAHTGFFLECCAAARHNPRIKATLALLFSRFREAVILNLEQLPAFKDMDKAAKAQLAATVVAIHEGIELQFFADPDSVSLSQTLDMTRQIIEFFINRAALQKGGE